MRSSVKIKAPRLPKACAFMKSSTITLAITGASGSAYALRLLECLVKAEQHIYLLVSDAARLVIATETGIAMPESARKIEQLFTQKTQAKDGQIRAFAQNNWFSPVASGSNAADSMIVCPCSTGTLSGIAQGSSNNLIERAADVMIKEQRKLILMVRETPLSPIHLENMLKLSRLGIVIMPASPGFYYRPETIDEIINFMVARALDHLGIAQDLLKPWASDN